MRAPHRLLPLPLLVLLAALHAATAAPEGWFRSVAISADARMQFAVGSSLVPVNGSYYPSRLWASADGGGNFTLVPSLHDVTAVAASSDGGRVAAATTTAGVQLSADGGLSWRAPPALATWAWRYVACSSTGRVLLAAPAPGAFVGYLALSTDFGVGWANATPAGVSQQWRDVAVSSDGATLAALNVAAVTVSTDGGATFRVATPAAAVFRLAASSSGATMLALQFVNRSTGGASLTISTDAGATWAPAVEFFPSSDGWNAPGVSPDGLLLLASALNNLTIYRSADGGATWAPAPVPVYVDSLAVAADSQRVLGGTGLMLVKSADGGASWARIDGTDSATPSPTRSPSASAAATPSSTPAPRLPDGFPCAGDDVCLSGSCVGGVCDTLTSPAGESPPRWCVRGGAWALQPRRPPPPY